MTPEGRKFFKGVRSGLLWSLVVYAVAGCAAFGITYLLALAGEPQSVWIMRDVLDVL